MANVAGYAGVYRVTDGRMRANFANRVVANAMHPYGSTEEETLQLAREMQQRTVDLLDPVSTFLQAVDVAWLKSHPHVERS